jgi:hypothetical protein
LDRFYGSRDGFGIGLRPAKAAGQALEKIFDFGACNDLVVVTALAASPQARFIWPLFILRFLIRLPFIQMFSESIFGRSTGRIRIVWAHGHLIAAIVGEFAA